MEFVIEFEKKQIDYFKELEEAINEVDLSEETKQHLIEIMYKDENILFGFVEEYFKEVEITNVKDKNTHC